MLACPSQVAACATDLPKGLMPIARPSATVRHNPGEKQSFKVKTSPENFLGRAEGDGRRRASPPGDGRRRAGMLAFARRLQHDPGSTTGCDSGVKKATSSRAVSIVSGKSQNFLPPPAQEGLKSRGAGAWSTARRCRDKHLEEALRLSRALSEGLRALGEAEARPLLRCVLAFQMEATGSSSSFQKLEQMVTQLAVGKEALLSREVGALLAGLVPPGEVLSPGDLQSVCMFMEESSLGRQHWQQNLAPLLQGLATTLRWVLRSQPPPAGTWGYLAVKACLQLFQALPKDVAPLVWSTAGKSKALQSLLGLLLEVSWGKSRPQTRRRGCWRGQP
ncbi:PREDICTED: uncharacterized protein LOC106889177 [Calidris pugnax]|uniref:uncharacterized protein LOC106889177 n=1 Tax=Calidris pugnax TaxID=198806 RepID=UPI00071C396E|nr:PREDICTED: uncharacterized protein LOC106889177 [Calidris pugnax]